MNRILAIGYYDDFARFFLSIKKEFFKNNQRSDFKYISLYLSGYIYWILRSRNVSLISFISVFKILKNKKKYKRELNKSSIYKGIDTDLLIEYHTKLGVEEDKIKIQACFYIDYFLKEIVFNKPDVVICSSDSRLISEVVKEIAKLKGVKIYFFEQGPFGTTIIDRYGVNANSSIRGYKSHNKKNRRSFKDITAFIKRKKMEKYARNPLYRMTDYIIESMFGKTKFYPVDLIYTTNNTFIKKYEINFINENSSEFYEKSNGNVFLLILQVPFDVNMIHHSPFYNTHAQILESVYESLPKNSTIIVREHPLYVGKYEADLYDFCNTHEIKIENKISLSKAFELANVVIVNNSTVGLEAITCCKTVVVLGNALYDNSDVCLKLKNENELSDILEMSLQFFVNVELLSDFASELYFNYLLKGHFRDSDLSSLSTEIVKKISE